MNLEDVCILTVFNVNCGDYLTVLCVSFFLKQSFISWCLHCYNGQKVLRSNQISKLPVLAARMWSSLSGTVEQQV